MHELANRQTSSHQIKNSFSFDISKVNNVVFLGWYFCHLAFVPCLLVRFATVFVLALGSIPFRLDAPCHFQWSLFIFMKHDTHHLAHNKVYWFFIISSAVVDLWARILCQTCCMGANWRHFYIYKHTHIHTNPYHYAPMCTKIWSVAFWFVSFFSRSFVLFMFLFLCLSERHIYA